jgi:hypothetical protein
MRDERQIIAEDMKIMPGAGATLHVGSDSYPYYVSEVLPNGVIGMYSPSWKFKTSWTDGSGEVDPFDSTHKTELFIKRRYKKWWKVEKDGKPVDRFAGSNLSFGHAHLYQDPSF